MSGGETGSALVEALVATAIVAGALGATFEAVAAAEHRQAALEQRRLALMVARSRLAAVGVEIPAAPGELEGLDGDLSWRVRIEPAGPDPGVRSRLGAPELVTVAVRPSRGGADLAVLKSLRLAAAP